MNSISEVFRKCGSNKRKALIPFLTAGFPTRSAFVELFRRAVDTGADMVEIGIPFSDPLADGRSIQYSSQRALEYGMNLDTALRLVGDVRNGDSAPVIFMSYMNPVMAFGIPRFALRAREAGVRGLIVPDIIVEEGRAVEHTCYENGIDLIYLLAPTSNSNRRSNIIRRSRGFVYLVSVAGITGTRKNLPGTLNSWIRKVKSESALPVCVGFGISTPRQARDVSEVADGIIVGSAIVDIIRSARTARHAVREAGLFIERLRKELNHG